MNTRTGIDAQAVPKTNPAPLRGLSALTQVKLGESGRRLLASAGRTLGGPMTWQHRKLAEAHDLLALAQIAPRFAVQFLDLRESLRAVATLQAPVLCLPDAGGNLRIARRALLGIRYPEEALRTPLPGFSFVEILEPKGVWHANVSAESVQMLCLGAQLPAGIQLKEIVLMTYGALVMATVMIDELDPAGVLNPEAARWWQHNIKLAPLSRASFLDKPKTGEA
jgi:hypothetical protein